MSQFIQQITVSSGLVTSVTAADVEDADLLLFDVTTNNVSITAHGFVPKAPNIATEYLDGTGNWSTPAGGGGGSGTVTSVAITDASGVFAWSGTPITTTGTFSSSLASQSAHFALIGPTTGSAAPPTFRALVAADIPALSYLTANQTITLSGDATGSGATAITVTLDTVNANVGTFQGLTVNAKGLVTAAANQSYLTANQTITLSGNVTGSGTTAIATTIPASTVTVSMMANLAAVSLLGNPTGSSAAPSAITLGSGLAFSGTTLTATGSGGTVTSVTAGTGLTGGTITGTGTIALSTAIPQAETLTVTDAGTNNRLVALTLVHATSGTPTTNFGVQQRFALQDSTTTGVNAAAIVVQWANATHATRVPLLSFSATDAAGTPTVLSISTDGSGNGTISVLGANPAAQQTGDAGTALVTFGWMSGTPTFACANLTGTLAAGQFPVLTGDITTAGGALATTLATVNSNVGTFQGLTVNAKGLVTAASNQSYLTANQTITLSGGVTGSGTTAITTTIATTLDAIPTAVANVSLGSHRIVSLADPVGAQDAVTLNYLTNQLGLLIGKAECQAATVTALAASTYVNGSSGVGATLTLTVAAVLVLDGYTPNLGDRLLIKNQSSALQNGVYVLSTLGTVLINAVLTRSLDFDQATDGINGAFTFIQNGTVNAGTGWYCSTFGSVTFGTTAINFTEFSGPGTYSAGTGLTLTGTTFSITNAGTAGTYTSVTTNAQGQVTAGTNPVTPWAPTHIDGLQVTYTDATDLAVAQGHCVDSTNLVNLTVSAAAISTASGAYAAFGGMDQITLAGTVATSTANATVTGSSTAFTTAFLLRALSGTITSSSTTVTGTNTKFLSQVAINDLIGTAAKGYFQVTAIASNTSLTLASTPGSAFSGQTPNCIEQPLFQCNSQTIQRVKAIASDTSLTLGANSSATVASGGTAKAGGLYGGDASNNAFYNVFALTDNVSNTGVILSSQRTTPYMSATYAYFRRISAIVVDSGGSIFPYSQVGGGHDREQFYEQTQNTKNLRVLSGGTATSFTAVVCSGVIPPSAIKINVYLQSAGTGAGVQVSTRNTGAGTTGVRARLDQPVASQNFSANIYTPWNGQSFDYMNSTASSSTFADIGGFVETV